MSQSSAVIFTHCHGLKYDDDFQNNVAQYREKYSEQFNGYFQCNKKDVLIKIVYAYIDQGLREVITQSRGVFGISNSIRQKERALKDVLELAEKQSRKDLGLSSSDPPKFKFIGLEELIWLFENLADVDPDLVYLLGGRRGKFYYDSPKFVEAVIRLARGDIPHLAQYPIIRVDDDAKVNAQSIRLILRKFETISKEQPFYFFSGRYGRQDNKDDLINDYAVRTHWFFPLDTKPGDPRFSNGDPDFKDRIEKCEIFLADLDVLGAQQPLAAHRQYSKTLTGLIKNKKLTLRLRPSPQVISGAGLCMGRRNVELLPPFMNFDHFVIWVDDHLKRDLHEKLRDIAPNYLESINDAKFEQHRPPIKNCDWYLERLIRGCMIHAIIEDDSGNQKDPSYAELIQDIVWFKKMSRQVNEKVKQMMRKRLQRVSVNRYEIVLQCWSSNEVSGYKSFDWATQKLTELNNQRQQLKNSGQNPNSFIPELCQQVVEDAMDYITLLLSWHKFTRAIERLPFIGNLWLYES